MKLFPWLVFATASVFVCVSCAGVCDVFDDRGDRIGDSRHVAGRIRKDLRPGSQLPGRFLLENLRPKGAAKGLCASRRVEISLESGVLRFFVGEESPGEDGCDFDVELVQGDGCPADAPKHLAVKYIVLDDDSIAFSSDFYFLQVTFPVPRGSSLLRGSDVSIILWGDPVPVELEKSFPGLELVRKTDGDVVGFDLKATKLFYLTENTDLTLIATAGGRTRGRTVVRLSPTADSTLPRPEFERSFYNVSFLRSEMIANKDVFPRGLIQLTEGYPRISFSLLSLAGDGDQFALVDDKGISVRLKSVPRKLSCGLVFLQLTARISDRFGRQAEGFTSLLIRIDDDASPVVIFQPNDKEHLAMAVIVLSVVVLILLLIIIFGYFKYVGNRKRSKYVCDVCANKASARRRPMPRRMSDYSHASEILPPPLETLPETEVEDEADGRVENRKQEVTVASAVKTRKRSVTFRGFDDEARRVREQQEEEEEMEEDKKRDFLSDRYAADGTLSAKPDRPPPHFAADRTDHI